METDGRGDRYRYGRNFEDTDTSAVAAVLDIDGMTDRRTQGESSTIAIGRGARYPAHTPAYTNSLAMNWNHVPLY